jgi:mRNA interferase MazF
MRRGEIWVARLNPNQGAEVGKLRPVVILQADPIVSRHRKLSQRRHEN